MTSRALIDCQDILLRAGKQVLSQNVTLTLMPRTILHIQGPNGSGKSTLLKTLAGQLKPEQGRITYNIPQNCIFYLPQLHAPDLHCPISLKEIAQLDTSVSAKKSTQHLDWFPETVAVKSWNNASGGERMRALLARALTSGRQLLILDEPFNHLDRQVYPKIIGSLKNYLEQDENRAVIIVSHEPLTDHQDQPGNVKVWHLTKQGQAAE